MTTLPVHPGADAVLEALDPEQREVAAHPGGPMCVLAGAGTGKTRAITHRIAYGVLSGVHQPQRVLAVTFTARAAGEMRTRLRDLGVGGVQARTFHAASLRQLHYFWPQAIGGAAPEVMPHKAGAVAEAAGRLRLRFDSAAVRDVASEVEWSKVSLLTPETYAAAAAARRREPPAGLDPTAMARLVAAYEEVKTERGVIDFEDVLLLMVGILREHDEVARAVRSQYRHFVVDEYQDVNRLQQTLLDLWLGGRDDICVVGDPAQTIYSFTGASPEHLLGFRARHPQARTVELVRNYRSTPQVVSLANLVLRGPGGQRRSGAVELRAQRPEGPAPELVVADNDPDEAAQVATRIAALVADGHPPSEVAVLFRTNGQSESFETALAERGIPYLVRGGERFFSRKEVRDAIVLMRGAARSDDGSVPLPDLVRDVLLGAGWTREPPTSGGASRDRWQSLDALAELADQTAAREPEARMPVFVAELEQRAAEQNAPTVQGRHARVAARGEGAGVGCRVPRRLLRRPAAHLHGRHARGGRGGAPVALRRGDPRPRAAHPVVRRRPDTGRQGDPAAVAVPRRHGGSARRGRPVPAAPPRRRGVRGRPGRTRVRSTCRACGAALGSARERTIGRCSTCPATVDERLFEALREWRLETAREADVPAFVVFTDATLTAIAETAPADVAGLARINGVGPAKLERYGAEVLGLLSRFSESENA